MGDFNAKIGVQTNTSERATGCFDLGQRNERGDTLVEWATSNNFKTMNTPFLRRKQGGDGHGEALMETLKTKLTTSWLTNRSMVTDVTVIIPPSHRRRGATTVIGENRHHRNDTASSFSPSHPFTAVEPPRDRRRVASLLFRDCTAVLYPVTPEARCHYGFFYENRHHRSDTASNF